jgi:hypothetical protein
MSHFELPQDVESVHKRRSVKYISISSPTYLLTLTSP